MAKIIEVDFEDHLYITQEVICINCRNRWISVRDGTWLKDLECPYCGITGDIIATGQILDEEVEE